MLLVFEPGLQMDAVGPDVDVARGDRSRFCQRCVLVVPAILQAAIVDADKPRRILAEQAASASAKSPVEMPFR